MIKRGRGRRNLLPSFLAVGANVACAAFLGGGLAQPAHAAERGFYRVQQRGPRGPVHSVSVDRQGFVWSAGPAGACRFDGLTTRCLDHGPADVVAASTAGDDVWAVLSGGKLHKIFPATPPSAHWQVPGLATGLLVTQDRVWVVGTRGLFVLQKEPQQQNLLAVSTAPGKSIVRVDGGAVVALTDGHMVRYDFQLRPTSIGRPEITTPVSSLSQGADGGWLVATPADMWRAHKRNQGFSRVEFSSALRTPPRSVLETDDGAIWIGTAGGLFHLAAGAKEATDVKGLPYSSPNFAVTDIASSAADRVWLATPVGLFEVEAQFPSKTLSHAGGDAVTIAFAVAPARSDGVWFSSADGINFSSHDLLQRYGRAEGLNLPDLRAVAVDNNGDVWAGGLGSGLFKLDPTQKRFLPQPALWSKGVRAILPSRKGGLWLGLSDSGLVWVKDARAQVLLPAAAKGATEVLDMLEHEDGSLWVTLRTGGLAVIRQGVAEHFRLPNTVQDVELLCLLNDGDGGVLVGSNGKGLLRIVDGVVQQVTMQHGLADDHIYGLTTDHRGRLWMSSPDGVSYAQASHVVEALNGRRESFHSVMWGREEGITGEPIRAFPKSAATLSDGTLAFPALDGLIQIDPALIRTPVPPVVVLDEIDLGAEGTDQGETQKTGRFQTNAAALRFSFSAPKHPRPHRLKFRFRLLGLDTAWRVGAGTGEARYVGVGPGTYHFEVQALAEEEDGGPSTVVSATVRILPPWYRTWQFQVLALALVVAALYWLYRLRTARAAKLLDAKAAERRRIAADIHDGLSQDLVGLRLQLEAAQASLQKDPTSAQKFLHRAGLLLEDGCKDLRDCIWGLTHDEVDTDALANGLRDRLLRSTQDSAVSLHFENLSERCSIAPGAAWQITQIAREAVANAIKHAAAKHIAVSLRTVANSMILAVEDDGLGMANEAANPGVGRGFGMSGMKARAETLGATLAFLHNPSGGTRVELIIPRTRVC